MPHLPPQPTTPTQTESNCMNDNTLWNPALDDDLGFRTPDRSIAHARAHTPEADEPVRIPADRPLTADEVTALLVRKGGFILVPG